MGFLWAFSGKLSFLAAVVDLESEVDHFSKEMFLRSCPPFARPFRLARSSSEIAELA